MMLSQTNSQNENALAESADKFGIIIIILVYFIVLYRIRHKWIDAILVQYLFKHWFKPVNSIKYKKVI